MDNDPWQAGADSVNQQRRAEADADTQQSAVLADATR